MVCRTDSAGSWKQLYFQSESYREVDVESALTKAIGIALAPRYDYVDYPSRPLRVRCESRVVEFAYTNRLVGFFCK